jgi:hypothetical protein
MVKKIPVLIIILSLLFAGTAHAGGVKEVAIGAGFGTALGVLVGGTGIVLSNSPEDVIYKRYLWAGGISGFVCGVVFGILVPADQGEPAALIEMNSKNESLVFRPQIIFSSITPGYRPSDFALHANLLKLDF